LYPALHALLRDGDLAVHQRMVEGKIRKCYLLTAKGRGTMEPWSTASRTI